MKSYRRYTIRRIAFGLTQQELAKRAGCSLGDVIDYENGVKVSKQIYQRIEYSMYKLGTLFEIEGRGLIFTQMRFQCKYAYWDSIDYWLANDIYLHPGFKYYFDTHATEKPYPIIEVRSAMWAMRMKPLPKEEWEKYF